MRIDTITTMTAYCAILPLPAVSFVPITAGVSINIRADYARRPVMSHTAVVPPSQEHRTRRKRLVTTSRSLDVAVDTTNAPVQRIASNSQYLQVLAENEDSLVVTKFYAPWCRSCKGMDSKYRQLAMEKPNVKFYEIDVAASPELKKALGVRVVPTVKLHAGPLGQVASFTCGPKKLPELERHISAFQDVSAAVSQAAENPKLRDSQSSASAPSRQPTSNSNVRESQESTEQRGLMQELVDKLAKQETLADALSEAKLSQISLATG